MQPTPQFPEADWAEEKKSLEAMENSVLETFVLFHYLPGPSLSISEHVAE